MITGSAGRRRHVRIVAAVAMLLVRRFMMAVDGVLDVLAARPARLAEEGQENEAPAVKAGQQGRDRAEEEGDAARGLAAGEGRLEDRILGPEAGEARDAGNADAGDRQRADDHHPEGEGDVLTEAAVITHVLLVVHGVDDAARAEEQKRLEKGVREKVEHRRAVSADAGGEEHVAELRASRIGDHPLDVVLRGADGGGEEGRRGADISDDIERRLAGLEHRRQAADHEHAGGDHRRGVDQGADRGRAFHRVRQPGVQPKLGRFTAGADEQQDAQQGHGVDAHAGKADGRSGHARRRVQDLRNRNGAEHQEGAENAEAEAEIADAVDDKGFQRGGIGRWLVVPETDEEVGRQPDPFPAEKHLHQAVGGHQHQHGEAEQRQIGEEPRLARVLLHIAPAVEVDEA